ncbi:MAG: Rne/Rng family ribonuclease, partial [Francisellaceae bacterium]|nr:Rne/Rng family ribonuclease [Francisellaceae bacterium]
MTKRMLINASQPEQVRIALIENEKLLDLDIDTHGSEYTKANIYKGVVTRIEPSLEAAFVDYGGNRHGFLPFREISREYFKPSAKNSQERVSIKDAISVGNELIVQIDKEERGNKGAALSTYLCLAGCYIVLMPNNPKAGGISRRVDGEEREELKEIMNTLSAPDGMGIIVRTAGVGRNIEELEWDLNVMLAHWNAIQNVAKENKAPFLIYQDNDIIYRSIRENLRPDIEEIIIDNHEAFKRASEHVKSVKPDMLANVKMYSDAVPLFTKYKVEQQISSVFNRNIQLPSGGSIVIDHTEALVSIDINSAKATKAGDIEATAVQTNLEAADEIARQMRLRDLGGLIVIDFIDMSVLRNQRQVEQTLKDALSIDRARVQVGRISRFGLLEMSRQRLKTALTDSHHIPCPRCKGQGTIYSVSTLVMVMLHDIEELSTHNRNAVIKLELPLDSLVVFMNEKRTALDQLQKKYNIRLVIIPNNNLQTPDYILEVLQGTIENYSMDKVKIPAHKEVHYEHANMSGTNENKAAIDSAIIPQAPTHISKKPGIIQKIWKSLVGEEDSDTENKKQNDNKHRPSRYHSRKRTQTQTNRKYKPRKPTNYQGQDP